MRCPACGGPDGAHFTLHQRFPQGGGGVNYPCPLGPKRGPYQAVTKVSKAVARDSYDRGLPISMAGEPDWFDQDRDAHTFTKEEMGVSFEALHVKSSARYSYAVPVKGKDVCPVMSTDLGTHHASVSILDDDGTIIRASVAFLRWDERTDGRRSMWRWHVYRDSADPERWETIAVGEDIWSGVDAPIDPVAMLGSLGSFLAAFDEAQRYPDSENGALFPEAVAPYAEGLAAAIYNLTGD